MTLRQVRNLLPVSENQYVINQFVFYKILGVFSTKEEHPQKLPLSAARLSQRLRAAQTQPQQHSRFLGNGAEFLGRLRPFLQCKHNRLVTGLIQGQCFTGALRCRCHQNNDL